MTATVHMLSVMRFRLYIIVVNGTSAALLTGLDKRTLICKKEFWKISHFHHIAMKLLLL